MILDKIQKYGFMVLSAALGALLLAQTVRLHGSQLAEAKAITTLANERAESNATALAKQERVRNAERSLFNDSSESRKQINDQVRVLSARNASLLERVRLAEERSSTGRANLPSTASTTGTGQAGTGDSGAELLGSLGTADVQEASRADLIRLHLASCYRDYDRARETLSGLSK